MTIIAAFKLRVKRKLISPSPEETCSRFSIYISTPLSFRYTYVYRAESLRAIFYIVGTKAGTRQLTSVKIFDGARVNYSAAI